MSPYVHPLHEDFSKEEKKEEEYIHWPQETPTLGIVFWVFAAFLVGFYALCFLASRQ